MSKYLFKDREVNLSVDYIHAFDNEQFNGVRIEWYTNGIGFGQCDVLFDTDEAGDPKITADTECMCRQNDKDFLRALFDEILDKIEVIG